jgi:hypothetical protein
MAYTVTVYVGLRFRDRANDGPIVIGVGVFVLTIIAHALFVIVGTLFGERFFTSTAVINNTILPAVYNIAIAAVAFPLVTRLIGSRRRFGWAT